MMSQWSLFGKIPVTEQDRLMNQRIDNIRMQKQVLFRVKYVPMKYIPGQVFGLGIRNKLHAKKQIPWKRVEMFLNGIKQQLQIRHMRGGFKKVKYVWFYFEFGKKMPGKIGRILRGKD